MTETIDILEFRGRFDPDTLLAKAYPGNHNVPNTNPDPDFTNDPGLTVQHPKEDTDINILMERMGVKDGSKLPYFTNPMAIYGDFSQLPTDPTEVAQILHDGELAFMKLPAKLRQRFENTEALFAFMNDNENYDEAVRIGLLEKPKTPAPRPVSTSTSSDKEPLVPNPQHEDT